MYDANNSYTVHSFINFCDNIFHIRLDYVWSKYNKSNSSHWVDNKFYTVKLFIHDYLYMIVIDTRKMMWTQISA